MHQYLRSSLTVSSGGDTQRTAGAQDVAGLRLGTPSGQLHWGFSAARPMARRPRPATVKPSGGRVSASHGTGPRSDCSKASLVKARTMPLRKTQIAAGGKTRALVMPTE